MEKLNKFYSNNIPAIHGILAFVLFFSLLAGLRLLDKQKDVVGEKKTQLFQLRTDLEKLDKALKDVQDNQQQMTVINSLMPVDYDQVALFTSELERVAKEKNQQLEVTIDQNIKKEDIGVSSLKFTIDTTGTFSDYSSLLSSLSNFSYPVRLDQLKVEKSGSGIQTQTIFRLFVNKL